MLPLNLLSNWLLPFSECFLLEIKRVNRAAELVREHIVHDLYGQSHRGDFQVPTHSHSFLIHLHFLSE